MFLSLNSRYQKYLPTIPELGIPKLSTAKLQCDLHNDDLLLNLSSRWTSNDHLDTGRFFSESIFEQNVCSGPTFTATDHTSQFKFLETSDEISTDSRMGAGFTDVNTSYRDNISNAIAFSVIQIIFIVVDIIVLMYRCTRTYTSAKMLQQGFRETKLLEFHKGKGKEKLLIIHENVLRQVAINPAHNSHSTEEKELSSFEYTNNSIPQYATNDSHRGMLSSSQQPTTPQHHLNTHVNHANRSSVPTTTANTAPGGVDTESMKAVHVTAIRDEDARKWTQRRRCYYFHVMLNIAQSNAIPKILVGVIFFIIFYVIVDLLYIAISDGSAIAEMGAFQVGISANCTIFFLLKY